jgi:hypothetical protein
MHKLIVTTETAVWPWWSLGGKRCNAPEQRSDLVAAAALALAIGPSVALGVLRAFQRGGARHSLLFHRGRLYAQLERWPEAQDDLSA